MEKDIKENNKKSKEVDYVEGYRTIIWIIAVMIILGGIFIGILEQGTEANSINYGLVAVCWGTGGILILILNLLKDIINELRILNSKIK